MLHANSKKNWFFAAIWRKNTNFAAEIVLHIIRNE